MTILAIDTATKTIGIGLVRAEEILYEKTWRSDNFHTVELAPAVKAAFKEASIRKGAIRTIAIANGPGSYTGLRIGLAFAKGFAFNKLLKIAPIPTLDILAAGHPLAERQLIAIIQAGRGRLNAAHYEAKKDNWQLTKSPYITTLDDLYSSINTPAILCGELSVAERKRLRRKHKMVQISAPALGVRRPAILGQLALNSASESSSRGLTPEYLKTQADLALQS
jgi:tRNA threonylcarbamoyladenosine biosynthesis protein TsaB